ncbi:predicted protein, partial [Nematostella vectensis]
MSEPVPGKPKGRKKLDSIISKLRLKPAEACDSEEESGPVQSKGGLEEVIDSGGEALDSGEELTIRHRSKRKSGKTVHYQRLVINDDDDDDDGVEEHALDDLPPPELPLEDAGSIEDTNITAEEVPPYDNIADLLSDGPRLVEEDETVVLIVPPGSIKVQAAAVEGDELRDLSEIEEEHEEHKPKKEKRDKKKKDKKKKKESASAAESNEEGEKEKEKKKSKKKKKVADSDVSMDEDGLPKRVTCTACGRHINPSHGKILRHPTLNVLVCKKCNQYYNSGPFTRDEYGIEEQCRWCGDGGALICCDKCEKAFCQPCIKRNCGKAYLKEVMNAPDDYHWNCFSCKLNNPLPAVAQLQKRCNYVMDILDSLRSRKAPFKSKIGQPNVISGPTPLERRSQLNTLSGTLGIKVEGWLSSPEKSPTKKEFSKVVEPPPLLFDDSEAGPSNAKQDEKGKEKKADKRSDEPQDKEDKTTGNEKERPGRMIVRRDYSVLTPFLPAKHEYVIKVRLSEAQRKLYEHYLKTFVFPEGDVTKRGVCVDGAFVITAITVGVCVNGAFVITAITVGVCVDGAFVITAITVGVRVDGAFVITAITVGVCVDGAFVITVITVGVCVDGAFVITAITVGVCVDGAFGKALSKGCVITAITIGVCVDGAFGKALSKGCVITAITVASAAESNEEGEKEKEKKKSKKKKKVADSDVSMDEDGLPKRVTCTACGRHINPSHGKILRHPTLNVLVCKKCNQYYNSGPFTRDEYGIEEQCRWCGDGGALICCDKCEKAFCQPCIKRNCGKAYLKEVMNAPDDYHWNCFSCKLNNPLPAVAQLQKRCNYVMDILDSLRSRKAPFKSKIGQPNVISGPTPLERRSQLNTLSGTLGIKVEGWLSSPEKSPTKKEFSKVVEPPPLLFDDSEAGPSNAKQDEKGKEKKADKRSDEPQDKEDKTTGNEKERPGRMIVRLDEVSCKTKKQKEQDTDGKSSDEDGEGIDEPNLLERISEMSRTEEGKLSERTENEGKISEGEEKNEGAGSSTSKTSRMLRSKSKVISEITKEAGSDSGSSSSRKETRRSKKKNNESRSSDTKEVSRHGKTDKKNNDKKDDESSRKDKVQEEDDDVDDDQPNEMVKQESGLDSKDESEEVEERRTTRSGKTNRSGKDSQSKLTTQSSAKKNTEEVSKSSKKQEVIILDDDYSSSEEPVTKRTTRSERKRNELVKKEVLSGNDSESSLEKQNKKGTQKGKKGKQAKTSPESDSSESSDDENRISTLKVRFGFAKGARSSRSKHSNSDSTSKNRKKPVKMEKVSENDESDSDLVSKKQSGNNLSENKKTTPLNTKYDSKSESGDSDFVSKKQSKKNATSKNNNKTPVKPEGSSGSEESDSNSKTKPSNKKSSVKKNKKMEQSESGESSDSGPKRRKGNSQKRMVNQKSTRKRPRPASSDSSSAESPEQSSEESSESSEEESARKQRLRRRQRLEDSDDSDGEDTKTKKSKIQKQKKTPKRRRTRANKGKSSSEEPSESESEESSDDSEVKKRPKRNAKRN